MIFNRCPIYINNSYSWLQIDVVSGSPQLNYTFFQLENFNMSRNSKFPAILFSLFRLIC